MKRKKKSRRKNSKRTKTMTKLRVGESALGQVSRQHLKRQVLFKVVVNLEKVLHYLGTTLDVIKIRAFNSPLT
jgi:hypothetical protein